MQLTRAADYAVRVMIHLATPPVSGRSSLNDLAAAAEVSPAFLSKVLQRLVHSGLVASHRGKGGFELLDRGRSASLYEVLQALDGVPELNMCLLPGGCSRSELCVRILYGRRRKPGCGEILSSATLEKLACETRILQQAARRPGTAFQRSLGAAQWAHRAYQARQRHLHARPDEHRRAERTGGSCASRTRRSRSSARRTGRCSAGSSSMRISARSGSSLF